ncbi:MAG: DUF2130 domain-containing protein [Gemmatimonadales bacterium]
MSTSERGAEPAIVCPNCGTKVQITKALGAQVEQEVRRQFEADLARKDQEHKKEIDRLVREAKEKAGTQVREAQALEIEDLRQQLAVREEEVETFRETELGLRRRERELVERAKGLELETQRRLQEEGGKIEAAVIQRLAEQHRLESIAKDKKLADLQQQLSDAHRRAQQGSQQTQGEALEVDQETALRQEFPLDNITSFNIGQRSADLLQEIRDTRGVSVGSILWEDKNTKNFSEKWLAKLREDQRNCRAVVAVLVTKALPEDITSFAQRDGVWIASPAAAVPLAHVLRFGLIEAARVRIASQNQNEKQAALYAYLSGVEFKQRIEGILEPLAFLLSEHEREERAHQAGAARREKALKQAITSLAALYGGVSGVVGGALPRIDRLELPPPSEDAA